MSLLVRIIACIPFTGIPFTGPYKVARLYILFCQCWGTPLRICVNNIDFTFKKISLFSLCIMPKIYTLLIA